MQASLYGSWNSIVFNSRDVLYIEEDGFECITHLINGKTLSLSWRDMQNLLQKLPRVFCHECHLPIYLNPKEISTYYCKGYFVTVEFRNGAHLKELSRVDFERNVVSTEKHEKEFS